MSIPPRGEASVKHLIRAGSYEFSYTYLSACHTPGIVLGTGDLLHYQQDTGTW